MMLMCIYTEMQVETEHGWRATLLQGAMQLYLCIASVSLETNLVSYLCKIWQQICSPLLQAMVGHQIHTFEVDLWTCKADVAL